MGSLSKTIEYINDPGTLFLVAFNNSEGKYHRENGPALIWYLRNGSVAYFYYRNGVFYRQPKNGKDQPSVVKKTAHGFHYSYHARSNCNLPYYAVYKFNGDYTLKYPNCTVIGDPQFKKIVYHSGGHVSYCCEGPVGLQCLNGEQIEIPLDFAIAQVRHVRRRGFSEWPLYEML